MKIKALLLTFCFVSMAYADTNTSRAGLVKPSIGTTGWGAKTNTNWDIADSSFSVLNATETFTAAKTFTNPVTMSSSETVTGNFGVSGVVNRALTVTSSVTVSGNAGLTGVVTLGGAGNSVTVSSTAILPGATFYPSAPIVFGSTLTFSPTTIGPLGTTTNDSANAGIVGQSTTSAITTYTNVGTSNQGADLTSITLTAGDWDISLTGVIKANGATWTESGMWIGTTSGNSFAEFTADRFSQFIFGSSATSITQWAHAVTNFRVSLNTTTTIYLKTYAVYSAGGPPQAQGRISARRVR